MNATLSTLVELPVNLSEKAPAVPGLREWLLRFINVEVTMNEQYQQRSSPATIALPKRAGIG